MTTQIRIQISGNKWHQFPLQSFSHCTFQGEGNMCFKKNALNISDFQCCYFIDLPWCFHAYLSLSLYIIYIYINIFYYIFASKDNLGRQHLAHLRSCSFHSHLRCRESFRRDVTCTFRHLGVETTSPVEEMRSWDLVKPTARPFPSSTLW